MRIIICGGGTETPEDADAPLAAALDGLHARRRMTLVALRADADASPADMIADVWCDQRGIDRALFPETAARGAFADHDRNRLMLTTLRPEMVVILPGGPDTANLAHQARGMRIKVVEITPPQDQAEGEGAAPAQDDGQRQGGGAPPVPEKRGRAGAKATG
jgi:hypothetical protein